MRVLTIALFFVAALCAIASFAAASDASGAPPASGGRARSASKSIRGSRSISEVEALYEHRKNNLHKKIKFVHDLTADYFDRYLKQNRFSKGRDRYWLVLFYSSWCTTCDEYTEPLREVADILHEREEGEERVVLRQKTLKRGQMAIAKHDVTKDEAVATKYGVIGYPTLVLFDRDDEGKRTVYSGPRETDAILDFVNANMKTVRLESRSKSKSRSVSQSIGSEEQPK